MTESGKRQRMGLPLILRWFSALCLAVGLYMLFTLLLILIRGGEWDFILTVNNPKRRMASAAVALSVWFLLRKPRQETPMLRHVLASTMKLGLLFTSLALSFFMGEVVVRAHLQSRQASGGLEDFARMQQESGEHMNLQHFHALSTILRLSTNRIVVFELIPELDMLFGDITVRTNQDGMRACRDYSIEKPEGVTRIVGIGDSGMFGWEVEQGQYYLARLEESLRQQDDPPRYEVLNFGVPGYNTYQEVELFRMRGLAYDPDIVLLAWCENDFEPPFYLAAEPDLNRRDVSFLYKRLFNRQAFSDLTTPRIDREQHLDTRYVDPRIFELSGVEGVARGMRELRELQQEHGFHLLVFGPMCDVVTGICEQLGIPYANTYELIDADDYPEEYMVHYIHPRAEGHGVIAELLEQILRDKQWL